MKKMLSLLLVLSLVFLTACANTVNPDTTTEQTTDTTKTTETTTASETITEKKYVYETEIRETEPLQTESPELQKKIDEYECFMGDLLIMLNKRKPQFVIKHDAGEFADWIWDEAVKLIKENEDLLKK